MKAITAIGSAGYLSVNKGIFSALSVQGRQVCEELFKREGFGARLTDEYLKISVRLALYLPLNCGFKIELRRSFESI